MEMHERIKDLRKNHLKLSQEAFGQRLGVSRSVINNIERNVLARPDQKLSLIKLICKEFSVNENWLLDGAEPMFVQPQSFSLDEFVKQHGASRLELDIVKAYFELEPDLRRLLVQHFKDRIAADETAGEQEAEPTTEQLEAEYKKSRSVSARNAGLSASNTTAATGTDKAAGQ